MTIQLDSPTVASDLVRYAHEQLEQSLFFRDLRAGNAGMTDARWVFGQYYLWRNQFHRWFGVCITRSASFGENSDVPFVLKELTEHIDEEVNGDHHGMCVRFLGGIGITDPGALQPSVETIRYSDSFIHRYMSEERSGEEALAALAGREIVAPARNRMTVDALSAKYGVTTGLEFFNLHEELEVEHFKSLWGVLTRSYAGDATRLVAAAQQEIRDHVAFWDALYDTVLTSS
jgi:hypothetical protein